VDIGTIIVCTLKNTCRCYCSFWWVHRKSTLSWNNWLTLQWQWS